MIGGGDITKKSPSLTKCWEIINNKTDNFDVVSRDSLKYPRHGHSVTCLKDKFLIVTGSRSDE